MIWRDIDWHYINLSHRTDRKEYIEGVTAAAGISATRFDALRFEDYKGPPEDVALMMPTKRTIGNFLSHVALMELAATSGRMVGILEDDAILCADFAERMDYVGRMMPEPWDILFLGATYHCNPPVWHRDTLGRDFELTGIKHIHRTYGCWSNYAYVVNPASAAHLVHLMRSRMRTAAGSDTLLIYLQPELHCYSVTPGIAFQKDGVSDIGEGTTYFSHFKRSLGPYVYAERLSDFDYDGFDWAEGRVS